MLRAFFAVLLTLVAILAAGWLALRRADIPYDTLEMAYASEASQFLTIEGDLKVHVRDEGVRDGEVLVLVHGFSASLHTWEPWVRDLGRTYRVISLDLPGHGLTRTPDTSKMGTPYFVETVHDITQALGADRFTLIGNSMGGNTAWTYALTYPETLDGLVLVDASGWPAEAGDGDDAPFIFKLLENKIARALIKDLDMSGMIRSGLKDSFADPSFVTGAMVDRYAALSRAPGHRAAILALTGPSARRSIASAERLAAIDVPTLVMQGEADNLVPAAHARKFAAAISGAELIMYPDVGHLPHEEIARQSADDLRQFLETRIHPGEAAPAAATGGN